MKKKPPRYSVKIPLLFTEKKENVGYSHTYDHKQQEKKRILLRYFNLSTTGLHKVIITKRRDLTVNQSSHFWKSFSGYYVNMKILKFYQIFIIVTTSIGSFRLQNIDLFIIPLIVSNVFLSLSLFLPRLFGVFEIDLLEFLINILSFLHFFNNHQ